MLEDRVKQLVLLAVVVAHQRQRHAGLLGDLADRHHVVAVLRKKLLGRQQDRLLAVGPRSRDGDCGENGVAAREVLRLAAGVRVLMRAY